MSFSLSSGKLAFGLDAGVPPAFLIRAISASTCSCSSLPNERAVSSTLPLSMPLLAALA